MHIYSDSRVPDFLASVTDDQKAILKAFDIEADYVRRKASELSGELAE